MKHYKTEKGGDYMDFSFYPYESIFDKGVLYIEKSKLDQSRINVTVLNEDGSVAGILYLGGESAFIYEKNIRNPADITQSNDNQSDRILLAETEVLNAINKGDNYIISAVVLYSGIYKTIALPVSKQEVKALGFEYIPLEKVIDICRRNTGMAVNMIGTEIRFFGDELKKIKDRNFFADGKPGEEIIMTKPDGKRDILKRKIYMLRKKPSLSAPFVNIEEPRINEIRPLFKKDYWYELEVTATIPFHMDSGNSIYKGKIYRGFWQAQYDENGFPFLLTEMVRNSWEKLAKQYFKELQQEK
jgi:hypothetical protein